MKNLFKNSKILVVVLLLILSIGVLVACNADTDKSVNNDAASSVVDPDEDSGLTEVAILDSLDGIYDTSQQINDCSADCVFDVESEKELTSLNIGEFISVTDRNGNLVAISVEDEGYGLYKIVKADGLYIAGETYKISILQAGVSFIGKEEFDELNFTIHKDIVSVCEEKETIVEIKVGEYEIAENGIIVADGTIGPNSILKVYSSQEEFEYSKVTDITYVDGKFLLTLCEPTVDEVYEKLDIYTVEKFDCSLLDLEKIDEEAVKQSISESDMYLRFVSAIEQVSEANASFSLPDLNDFTISFKANVNENNDIVIDAVIAYKGGYTAGDQTGKLYVELKYNGVISYDVKANIETGLKTTYDFAVTANTKHKISLAVQWKDAEDDVLIENDEQLAAEITAILQDRSNIPSKVLGEAKQFGKTFEVPLCEDFTYVIPNTPITANIGFKWIIGVNVQGEIFTDLEMQSSDTLGVRSIEKDGEDSQEFYHIKSKDSTNDTMLMGAVTVKTGVRIDVYFSIVGMSKNIKIGIKGDAGIYLTVKGISLKTDINTDEEIGVLYGEVGLFVGYEVYGKVFVGFKIVGDDYSVKLFDFGTDEIYTNFVDSETTINTTKRITLNGNIDTISPITNLNKLAVNKFKVSEFGIETESPLRKDVNFEIEKGYITYYGGQFYITTTKHQFEEVITVTLKADETVSKTIIVTYDDGYVAPVETPSESESTTETPDVSEEPETPVVEEPEQPVETPDEGETETDVPAEPETPVVEEEEEEETIMSILELYDGNKKVYEINTQWVENENKENVEKYNIPALTKLGYTFKGYALNDGTLVTTESNGVFTYKMPIKTTETIKASAVWEKTYSNYIYVTTASDIKSIDKNANYYFLNNIDMWGVEFNTVSEFNGIIEGNGFTVSNFTISGDSGYTGFIGINNGTIKNLTIRAEIDYTSSKENIYCGIIAAVNKGTISNCSTYGEVNVEMKGNALFVSEYNGYVGGVVGVNDGGTISNCKTLANVYVTTNNVRINPYAGGFAGANLKGTISDSSANSYVKSTITNAVSVCKSYAGSFTALNKGVISGCYARAYDKTSGSDFVGGFAAVNEGSIKKCYSTGSISGKDNVGGLVGKNSGSVVNSYSQVNVKGSEKVGGLVGYNSGKISYAYASGNASGEKSIGGLVGENAEGASIVKCFAKGNVTSTKDVWITKEWAGGLVGKNDGTVTNCYRAQTQVLTIEDCECTVGTIVTQSVYNQVTFYTQILGFGSSTWNITSGKLPTLK